MSAAIKVPPMLSANPRLDRWVKFNDDRTATVFTGRVELGQGIITAMTQIAAEELDLSFEQVRIVDADPHRLELGNRLDDRSEGPLGGLGRLAPIVAARRPQQPAAAMRLELGRHAETIGDGCGLQRRHVGILSRPLREPACMLGFRSRAGGGLFYLPRVFRRSSNNHVDGCKSHADATRGRRQDHDPERQTGRSEQPYRPVHRG